MLEKIGSKGYEMLSDPDPKVLELVKQNLDSGNSDFVYYEIGVGVGATASAVAKIMDNRGEILLFSLEWELRELFADLTQLGYRNVNARFGSPSKIYSGYHFQLAKAFVDKQLPFFDLAYIDGGHVFHLDAPAACVLKEVCKPDGYMLFDDWSWTIAQSPSMCPTVRPETLLQYDDEQIKEANVQLVCNVVMDTDPRFMFHGVVNGTAVYQRRQ